MVFQLNFMDDDYEAQSIQLDEETGEHVEATHFMYLEGLATTNEETGEPEAFRLKESAEERLCSGGRRKKPFQIPRSALLQDEDEPEVKRSGPLVGGSSHPHGAVVKRQKSCMIEEHVGHASQNMNPAVFLLPTLFLFPAWASIVCIILELCIHMWAHRKNWERAEHLAAGDTSPPPAPYRSPLNTITSEFCAYCQSDKLMATIGKLQDERKTRLDNRKLRYCAYVERMSVVT